MDIKPKNKVNAPQSETNPKAPVPDATKTVAGFVMSEEIIFRAYAAERLRASYGRVGSILIAGV